MVSGFNTNVRHRGVVFHVQTEDSGRALPRIITHLYYEGTILASEKSEYGDLVDSPDLTRLVKVRMEAQHQAMLERLRSGALDARIVERFGDGIFAEPAAEGDAPARSREPRPAPRVAPASPPEPRPATRAAAPADPARKPLDELILDYLVENARKRKQRSQ